MPFESLRRFFLSWGFWQGVAASGVIGLFFWLLERRRKGREGINISAKSEGESVQQIAIGEDVRQESNIDRSQRVVSGEHSVFIEKVEAGASVTINFPAVDYQDGIDKSPNAEVRRYFEEGRKYYGDKKYREAIESFEKCLGLEKDDRRIGALNIQIGNCNYALRRFNNAAEHYGKALAAAERGKDEEGIASALVSIGNTYMLRPASDASIRGANVGEAINKYKKALAIFKRDKYPVKYAPTQNNLGAAYTDLPSATPEERKENLRKAMDCYSEALRVFRKDEYPVNYGGTQNNLGAAYTDLPSATPEERKGNVEKAMVCYREALKIYKKDEYPQQFCRTAANLGMALLSMDDKEGCKRLREAYTLREFLPDQGAGIEEIIRRSCD